MSCDLLAETTRRCPVTYHDLRAHIQSSIIKIRDELNGSIYLGRLWCDSHKVHNASSAALYFLIGGIVNFKVSVDFLSNSSFLMVDLGPELL